MQKPPQGWTVLGGDLQDAYGLTLHTTKQIILDRRLTKTQHRVALAHEIVHAERGPVVAWQQPREEAVVHSITARRLIPLPLLVLAIAQARDLPHMAVLLDVDEPTVRARLTHLRLAERLHIHHTVCPPGGHCACLHHRHDSQAS